MAELKTIMLIRFVQLVVFLLTVWLYSWAFVCLVDWLLAWWLACWFL